MRENGALEPVGGNTVVPETAAAGDLVTVSRRLWPPVHLDGNDLPPPAC